MVNLLLSSQRKLEVDVLMAQGSILVGVVGVVDPDENGTTPGRERLAPQLIHLLAPARRTARKQVIPSGVQSFRFGLR